METRFRLPLRGWPQAVVRHDWACRRLRLIVDGDCVLDVRDSEQLREGVGGRLPGSGCEFRLKVVREENGERRPVLAVEGAEALRESDLRAPTSRSAWFHAWIALTASAAGFVASYLYLLRARATGDPWPTKMAIHMAGWHLLLTLTLFPASVWGQRFGIRAVQGVSLVFFLIHLGIGIANFVHPNPLEAGTPWIAVLNTVSAAFFLGAVIYGNRAHRDMDPVEALRRRSRNFTVVTRGEAIGRGERGVGAS